MIRHRRHRITPLLQQLESRTLMTAAVATSAQLSSSAGAISVGQSVTLTATVTPQDGADLTGQWVQLWDAGTFFVGSAQLVNNAATIQWTPRGGGLHSITAEFPAQDNYARSVSNDVDLTVYRHAAAINLHANTTNPAAAQFSVTVASLDPLPFAPTGKVQLFDGRHLLGTFILGNTSTISAVLTAGPHLITASYFGDGAFYPAQTSSTIFITSSPQPTIELTPSAASPLAAPPLINSPALIHPTNAPIASAHTSNKASSDLAPQFRQFYESRLPPNRDANNSIVNDLDQTLLVELFQSFVP